MCKNSFFTLHPSFFIFSSLSFHTAKGKLWPRQRLCFIAWNMVFHPAKPYLSRTKTLPFANSDFVNRPFTDKYPCNHLSINTLRKTTKVGVFSTEWPFRELHPPFFGLKIRILFDKIPFTRIWNPGVSSVGICNVQHKKDIVEWNNIGIPDCKEMMPEASDKDCQQNSAKCIRYEWLAKMMLLSTRQGETYGKKRCR